MRWVRAPAAALIPELWSRGMELAQGNVVAITTSHFEPAPGWAEAVRAASARLDAAGIGGPIDAPRGWTAKDWATYFLRYSNTFHLQRAQTARYLWRQRRVPDGGAAEALERDRTRLLRARVSSARPGRQRHAGVGTGNARHPTRVLPVRTPVALSRGRIITRARPQRGTQILRVLAAPLIPFVFLANIGARVLKHRRHLRAFVYSLRVLVAFTFVWRSEAPGGYLAPIRTHQLTKL